MVNQLILITGATGFVGKHLVKKLINSNINLAVLVRKTSNISFYKEKNVKVFYIEDDYNSIFENNIIGIIHIATSYGQNGTISDIFYTNVVFPLLLLEEGLKYNIKFFINTDTFFTKSKSEYDYLNNYTKSKTLFVDLLKQFTSKLILINLKLEHVYGENDNEQKFIVQIINRLKKNELSIDLTDGIQKRDFIYIDDVVDAYLTVINKIEQFSNFTEIEVGTGKSISIKEAVTIIHNCINSSSFLNFGAIPKRKGEFSESIADIKILTNLGWKPKYDFTTGIKNILEHTN